MSITSNSFIRVCLIVTAAVVLSGCKQEVPEEGLVPGVPWLLGSTVIKLKPFGYEKAEYFIQGTAQSYEHTLPRTTDGKWEVEPVDEAQFRTRIVVYRPIDAAKFNGTAVVEWLNVSGGTEASSQWINTHTELMRSGYAWVGVSAQKGGIDGEGVTVLPISLGLKKLNPSRYGTLIHPGDQYSFDIFSQVARAIVEPKNFNPLGDLVLERIIASGQSQSADHLLTYVNAIEPRENLFDGYFIHSRVHGSAPLFPEELSREEIDFSARIPVTIRDDLTVPVLNLQTESDTAVLGGYEDRQPDSDMIRIWEVAGTAHADRYVGNLGLTDKGDDPKVAAVVESRYAIPVVLKCDKPVNSGPQHFVVKAALAALNNWVESGTPPSTADRFVYDEVNQTLVRDELGNAIGGIRTPYVDVPIAVLSGEGQDGQILCRTYGTTELFGEETLNSLYSSHNAFFNLFSDSVDDAVEKGFLLYPDGELIKSWAASADLGLQ